MKQKAALLLCLFMTPLLSKAQSFSPEITFEKYAPTKPSVTFSKKTSDSDPLLATSSYSYNSTYKIIDSTTYNWSGKRSSVQQKLPYPDVVATEYDINALLDIYGSGSLDYNSRGINIWNVDGTIKEQSQEGWVSGVWTRNEQLIYSYTGLFLQSVERKIYPWSTPLDKELYYYIAGKLDHIIFQYWNSSSAAWENTGRISYTYSGTDTASILSETYDGAAWILNARNNYSYAGGKMTECISQGWDKVASVWQNQGQWTYKYNAALLDTTTINNWNITTNTWQPLTRNSYTYTGIDLQVDFYEIWNNTTMNWESSYKYLYDYSGGNISKYTVQYWDTTTPSLEPRHQWHFTYNATNLLIETKYFYWIAGKWQHPYAGAAAIKNYYYASSLTLDNKSKLSFDAYLAPNPAGEMQNCTLHFSTNNKSEIGMAIFNQLGMKVMEQQLHNLQGTQSIVLPSANWLPGIYFVQLKDKNEHFQILKLVK